MKSITLFEAARAIARSALASLAAVGLTALAGVGYADGAPLQVTGKEPVPVPSPAKTHVAAQLRGMSDPCDLSLHAEGGTYESALSWEFVGVQTPDYGAFAERYEGFQDVCGVVLDLTTTTGGTGIMDVYVWSDAGGRPGTVRAVVSGYDPGTVATWPAVSRHVVPLSVDCAGEPIWVGFWGDWAGAPAPFAIAADVDGPPGDPQTNIAPGIGFPQGWDDVSTVWGPTASLGIGVLGLACGTTGACCLPDGSCQIETSPQCAALGGGFLGPDVTCSPNPCDTVGACCFQSLCSVLPEAACLAGSGSYQGDGTVCDPSPCGALPVGACCFASTCVVVEACECTGNGGVYIGDGTVCAPSPCGGVPDIAFAPTSLDFTLPPDATAQSTLTLSNLGASDLIWSLTEVEVLLLDNGGGEQARGEDESGTLARSSSTAPGASALGSSIGSMRHPVLRSSGSRGRLADLDVRVDSSGESKPVAQVAGGSAQLRGGDLVPLTLDDGTIENAIGLGGGGQFVWLNRYTPAPTSFPFKMTQVEILFPVDSGVAVGDTVDIYVYEDTDGDGDPATGAQLLGSLTDAEVQFADDLTWSVYPFPPVVAHGPGGDVLIAVVNRTAGIADGDFPASLDETTSQGRSWISAEIADPGDPPTFPGAALWGLIDAFVTGGGNWMLRGLGEKGGGECDWLTVDITSGTETSGEDQPLQVSVDATGLPVGDYQCDLVFTSNDPDEFEVTVTVLMHVSTAASAPTPDFEGHDRTLLFSPRPNPAHEEVWIDFHLKDETLVRLEVFDAQGRRVARLVDAVLPSGRHSASWSGVDLRGAAVSSGVYFYRMRAGAVTQERKLLRIK